MLACVYPPQRTHSLAHSFTRTLSHSRTTHLFIHTHTLTFTHTHTHTHRHTQNHSLPHTPTNTYAQAADALAAEEKAAGGVGVVEEDMVVLEMGVKFAIAPRAGQKTG